MAAASYDVKKWLNEPSQDVEGSIWMGHPVPAGCAGGLTIGECLFGSRSGGADVANSHIRVEDYLENPFALLFSGWMEVQFSGRMWIQCPLSWNVMWNRELSPIGSGCNQLIQIWFDGNVNCVSRVVPIGFSIPGCDNWHAWDVKLWVVIVWTSCNVCKCNLVVWLCAIQSQVPQFRVWGVFRCCNGCGHIVGNLSRFSSILPRV